MRHIKSELQGVIIENGQDGSGGQFKKIQSFLSLNEKPGAKSEEQKHLENQEESLLSIIL